MPWLRSTSTGKGDTNLPPSSQFPTHVHRQAPILPPTPRSLKVVLIGDGGAGKTSLRQRFLTGSFSRSYRATIGADFVTKTITLDAHPASGKGKQSGKNKARTAHDAQQRVTLAVWDTAGQERFRSLGSAFYRGADAAIIAYDVTSPGSLARTVQWVRDFCEKGGLGDPDELLGGGGGGLQTSASALGRNGAGKKRWMDEAEKEAARRFCWIAVGCKSDLLEQLGGGVAGSVSAPAASKAKGALEWKRRFAEARRHFDALIPRDDEDGQGPAGVSLDEVEEEGYNVDGAPTVEPVRAHTDVPAKPEDVLARPGGDRPLVVGHGSEAERPPGAGPPPGTAPTPGEASTEALLQHAASVPVPGGQGGTADRALAPMRRANGQHAATERTWQQKKRSSIRSIDVFQPPELEELEAEARRSRTRSVGRRNSRNDLGAARRTSLSTSSSSRYGQEPAGLKKKASFTSSIYRPSVLSTSPSSALGASPYSHSLKPRERYDSTLSSTSMGGNSVYHTPRNSTLFGSSVRSGETVMRDSANGTEAEGEEDEERKASLELGGAKVDIEGNTSRSKEEEIEVPVKRRSIVSSSSRNSATTMRAWRDSRSESGLGLKESAEEEVDGSGSSRTASGTDGKGKSKEKGNKSEAPIPFPTSSAEAGALAPPETPSNASIKAEEDDAAPTPTQSADDDVTPEEAARQDAEMKVGDTIRLIDSGVEATQPVLGEVGGVVVEEEAKLFKADERISQEEGLAQGVEVELFQDEATEAGQGDARQNLGVINRDEALWRGRDAPPGLGKRIVTALWRGDKEGPQKEEGGKGKKKEEPRHHHDDSPRKNKVKEEEEQPGPMSLTTDTLRPPPPAHGGEGREPRWRDSLLTADPSSCGSTIRGASPGPDGGGESDGESSDGHGSDQSQEEDDDEGAPTASGARLDAEESDAAPPPVPSGFTLLLCSSKTGEGVEEVFDAVVQRVSKRWEREEWEERRLRRLEAEGKGLPKTPGAGKGWGWNALKQPDEEEVRRGIQIASGKATGGGVFSACCSY